MSNRYRPLLFTVLLLILLGFGGGYAYSALSMAQQSAIRIAYANGYKDGLDFAVMAGQARVNGLVKNMPEMRSHVMLAADGYIKRVEAMNQ